MINEKPGHSCHSTGWSTMMTSRQGAPEIRHSSQASWGSSTEGMYLSSVNLRKRSIRCKNALKIY